MRLARTMATLAGQRAVPPTRDLLGLLGVALGTCGGTRVYALVARRIPHRIGSKPPQFPERSRRQNHPGHQYKPTITRVINTSLTSCGGNLVQRMAANFLPRSLSR